MEYSKGSEWRKWDLHIHTPCSIIQHYWWNTNEIWEKFIKDLELLPDEYKIIWINDYNFIDWYEKVLEYKKAWRLKNIDLFLPVIEFRLTEFWWVKELKAINYHVIFSDKISIEKIKTDFINKLSVEIEWDWEQFTITNKEHFKDYWKKLIDLGIALNSKGESNEQIWFNQARFSKKDIEEILKKHFNWDYLIAIWKNEW